MRLGDLIIQELSLFRVHFPTLECLGVLPYALDFTSAATTRMSGESNWADLTDNLKSEFYKWSSDADLERLWVLLKPVQLSFTFLSFFKSLSIFSTFNQPWLTSLVIICHFVQSFSGSWRFICKVSGGRLHRPDAVISGNNFQVSV